MSKATRRCAIYTRKSSDEGLEQEFNSLDAQREAGEAYIASQAHEGWTLVATRYDDGGYSGGTMERPGLQQLLRDVEAGEIDVVVVYKIDRLTRSLPDFARIVEAFDAREVSFVSVTQAFNTTSSMGRLTLNVLLSFAQFEREVTGERIRDKIAASKARGMWMGGVLPLGYDLPRPGTRTLVVNAREAAQVTHIFTRYCDLGSVHALQRELAEEGIASKHWVTRKGKPMGGRPFSRGALFHLLRNPVYLGLIRHKDERHQGEHDPIIAHELFDKVQAQLDRHTRRHKAAAERRTVKAPLTGKLYDAAGEVMTPSFSRGSSGKLYRYYVSASLQQGGPAPDDGVLRRVAASAIERLLTKQLEHWSGPATLALADITRIQLERDRLLIDLPAEHREIIASKADQTIELLFANQATVRIALAVHFPLRGGQRQVVATNQVSARPDAALIAALRKAHRMLARDRGFPTIATAPASSYDRKVLRLAFLAPDIQRDILTGRQPLTLNLEHLQHTGIPLDWAEQRVALGWDREA